MLLYVEGFNEINNFGFTYNGFNPDSTFEGLAQAMHDLYTMVRSTNKLNGIPVLDLTGGTFSDGTSFGLDNYTWHADMGNIHAYQGAGNPAVSIGGACNMFLLGLAQYPGWQNPTSNYVVTETGYHTSNFTNGVTEIAASKLIVNTLLNGIAVGFAQTYIYELLDEVWDDYSGNETRFPI
jgi:hypothetical protein